MLRLCVAAWNPACKASVLWEGTIRINEIDTVGVGTL